MTDLRQGVAGKPGHRGSWGRVTLHDVSRYLFIAGAFLKQFYILPSGSFQLGDLALMLSAGTELVYQGLALGVDRIDLPLALFVLFETAINLIYSVVYSSSAFFQPVAWYLFNLIVVVTVRGHLRDERFIRGLAGALRAALVVQVLVLLSGRGRQYAGIRYMGTFNDPNQFAFFVFSSFLILKVCTRKGFVRAIPLDDVVGVLLALESSSTGMMLGFLLYYVFSVSLSGRDAVSKLFIVSVSIIISTFFMVNVVWGDWLMPSTGYEVADKAVERINQKILKIRSNEASEGGFLSDRNMTRVMRHPEFFLFGSGESMSGIAGEGGEIHSTPVGLAFYYGVIPFALFVTWVRRNYRQGSGRPEAPPYLALLLESFLLAHQRQPFLYVLVALSSVPPLSELKEGVVAA